MTQTKNFLASREQTPSLQPLLAVLFLDDLLFVLGSTKSSSSPSVTFIAVRFFPPDGTRDFGVATIGSIIGTGEATLEPDEAESVSILPFVCTAGSPCP